MDDIKSEIMSQVNSFKERKLRKHRKSRRKKKDLMKMKSRRYLNNNEIDSTEIVDEGKKLTISYVRI